MAIVQLNKMTRIVFKVEVVLLGISLGGAAVIGAVEQENAIGALVVERLFADLNLLIEPNWNNETHLPKFFSWGVLDVESRRLHALAGTPC